MKAALAISLALLVGAGGAYLWLFAGYAEREDISSRSLTARLLIPSDIRTLDLPKRCAPVTYSRQHIECGGVCGTSYRISYGTTASLVELKAFLSAQDFAPELQITRVNVILDPVRQDCTTTTIFLDSDERESS